MVSPGGSRKVRFGEFEIDLSTGEVRAGDRKFSLQEQPFQILCVFLERPGELVTREELKKRLWPSDTFVDFDHSLNKAVNRLREALDDSADHPRFIETLPRRGYRFIGVVANGGAGVRSASILSSEESTVREDRFSTALPDASLSDMSRSASATGGGRLIPYTRFTLALLAIALGAAGIYRWLYRNRPPVQHDLQITRLTDSGRLTAVAISADGRYVAYAQTETGGDVIHLRQVGTDSDIQIAPAEKATFYGLTFSPDNSYIYLVRSSPDVLRLSNLYAIPLLGGPARLVLQDVQGPVSFSPDGRQFAFTRGIPAQNSIEVRISDADGAHERLLATVPHAFAIALGAAWSPDGHTIATSLGREGLSGWVLDTIAVSGGSIQERYASPRAIGLPRWLPSGESLVVALDDPAQRGQLWTVPFPSGSLRRITNDLLNYDPSIDTSRSVRTIVALAQSMANNVWEAPASDPSNARQLTFGALPIIQVVEASDGKKLFARGWTGDLWTMRDDGGERSLLPGLRNVLTVVSCGDYIIAIHSHTEAVQLVRLDADGANPKSLAVNHPVAPVCSPDSRSVFFVELAHPAKIDRISIDGGAISDVGLALGDGMVTSMAISPDGRFLAYPFELHSGRSGTKIAVVPSEGGDPDHLFSAPAGIRALKWSPDGKALDYLASGDNVRNLFEQPIAGGPARQLTRFTSEPLVNFNWSRDGQRLLLVRGSITSDAVLLQGFE